MSGTKIGGLKAARTNKARHGEDFYSNIGRKGGRNSNNGGFASNKVGEDGLTGFQRARIAGAKGGAKSSREGVKNGQGKSTKKKVVAKIKVEEKPERLWKLFGRRNKY